MYKSITTALNKELKEALFMPNFTQCKNCGEVIIGDNTILSRLKQKTICAIVFITISYT